MNSKYLIFLICFYLFSFDAHAQIGIGTLSPNESSKLDLKSGTRGFLLTRMTLLQRNAISNPTAGLQIYCTDCGNNGLFQMYNGTTWVNSVGTATNIAVPSSPSNPVATVLGYTRASVSFTASTNNNGSQITYSVTSSPGNVSASGSTSPIVVDGLSEGFSYTFNVIAANLAGNSTASAASNLISMPAINGNAICDGSAYFDFNDITSTTGRVWMDRNLGATRAAISATDYYAYGCLYQWGRANDGHASINWSAANLGTAVNGISSSLSSSSSATNSLFINNTNTPYNWLNTQDNNLWQYSTNTNNPCPSGYVIPTQAELNAEFAAYGITNATLAYSNGPGGGGFKFVAPGMRSGSDGTLVNTGDTGLYWTQSVNGNDANAYSLSNNVTATTNYRSNGLSVRCIKGAVSTASFSSIISYPQDGKVLLQFNAVPNAIDYVVLYKQNSSTSWSVYSDGVSTTAGVTVEGLTNGVLYDFKVQANFSNYFPIYSAIVSVSPTAVVGSNVYHQILTTGQSLSLGCCGSTVLTNTQPFQNKMLNSSSTSLIPLIEPATFSGSSETKSSTMANVLSNLSLLNGYNFNSTVILSGVNGTAYSGIKKGTNAYNNGLIRMSAVRNIANSQGIPSIISAFTVAHGETDDSNRNTSYKSNLEEWQNDLETDSKLITGQTGTIPLFLCQMNRANEFGLTNIVGQAQLEAAEANPTKIYLVTPKYILDYDDPVHLKYYSYRTLGEYYGKVMKKVLVDGVAWKPLSPSSVSIAANVITVSFHVPVPPLQFDIVKILAKTNYGFEYYDSTNSATITNVALGSNGTSVIITLNTIPSGANKKIAYAYTGVQGGGAGRLNSGSPRGNLRDSDTTPALYTTNLPANFGAELNNWCVQFIKDIP